VQLVVGHDAQLEAAVGGAGDGGGLAASMARAAPRSCTARSTPTPSRAPRPARERGIALLDAPVSGDRGAEAAARSREMTFMIGGSAEALAAVRPCSSLRPAPVSLGPVGAGTLVKLAANAMSLVSMESTREAVRMMRRAGIDAKTALEVWRHTSGNSWAVENWALMHEMAARHPGGRQGLTDLGHKDLTHAARGRAPARGAARARRARLAAHGAALRRGVGRRRGRAERAPAKR